MAIYCICYELGLNIEQNHSYSWEPITLRFLCECTQTLPFSGVLSKGKAKYSTTDSFNIKMSYLASIWYIDFYV